MHFCIEFISHFLRVFGASCMSSEEVDVRWPNDTRTVFEIVVINIFR
jgi:hypothetical protein